MLKSVCGDSSALDVRVSAVQSVDVLSAAAAAAAAADDDEMECHKHRSYA